MTRPDAFTALNKILDNRALATILVIGLILAAAAMSRAANIAIAQWSAVSLGGDHLGGIVGTFRDISAGSTGFTSIPTARALANPPRWLSAKAVAVRANMAVPAGARLSLAIVGLPVDAQHDMLRSVNVSSYCITPQQSGEGIISLCQDPKQLYEKYAFSGKFNLCDFDSDCWHSTAVAIVASGNKMDLSRYPFEKWEGAGEFKNTNFAQLAKADYQTFIANGRTASFAEFVSDRFPGFGKILNERMPIAEISHSGSLDRAYITKNMMVEQGLRNGGPVLALNVFSRFESAVECDGHHKAAPCVLTTMGAQEEALKYILQAVKAQKARGANARAPAIGAIVIVAGGELTERGCDDTPIANLIGALRELGVPTFVPVGNDANTTKVRFPACAQRAVSVGSLTRDGEIASFSNGARSAFAKNNTMASIYVDGETVVLPIRGPRVKLPHSWSERDPVYCEQGAGNCEFRAPADQYDAYLAGGTLLSAAVVAGEYLNLRERHPTKTPEDVLQAMSGERSRPEADEYLAERALAHP